MSQYILDHLDIHARFTHSGREGVAEAVTTEVRQIQGVFLAFAHDFIIAVADDAAEGFVQCALVLWLSKAIDKDEICVAINSRFTTNAFRILSMPLLLECCFDEAKHWNLTNTIDGLRCMYITITPIDSIERFFDAAEINKIKIYLDRVIWITEKSSKNELAEKRRRAYSEELESYKKKYGGLEFRNNYWWAKVRDFGELAEKSGFDKLPIYSRLSGNVHFNAYDVFTYICTEDSVLIGGTYNGIELPLWLSSFFLYCICDLLQNSYPILISESTVERLLSCAEYLSERYYAKIGVKLFQT